MTPDETSALNRNNAARKTKGCPPLHWDANLAREATAYAQKLASTREMVHSGTKGEGENLYMTSPRNDPLDAGVKAWLDEAANYHGQKIGEGDFGSYGHYTQCMWKSTTHVGLGHAKDSKGDIWVVGRFTPPGNWTGQKPY
ncbi:hypothetical protein AAFC00_002796 [Neodothiora populina]|uniref:SCP domain-containing protein n=1 Tax=Neodothiora populina TaxID=2781224 RepID=A0ABR3P9J2_9PEZI